MQHGRRVNVVIFGIFDFRLKIFDWGGGFGHGDYQFLIEDFRLGAGSPEGKSRQSSIFNQKSSIPQAEMA
jgi:hypothetical protein